MSVDRKNKVVVITGCSSGIGKSAAETLSSLGYSVIATVRNVDDAKSLTLNNHSHVVVFDLAYETDVLRAADDIKLLAKGNLYALFNNAAYGQAGAVEDLTRTALLKQFQVNVFGTHQLTRELIPELIKQNSARVIQCSSILGFIGMPMRGAYSASKFALESLTDCMRMELSDTGVKFCLIEPGPILSRFRDNSLKALKKNVDFESSRHGWRYKAAIKRLSKSGATSGYTLGPEAVVEKLIHALESPKPKVRYYVTRPTYVMGFLKKVLPSSWIDTILIKYASQE